MLVSQRTRGSTISTSISPEWPRRRPSLLAISPTGTPFRPRFPTASALRSHPTPGAHRLRPCTSGTASSAATSLNVVVSTSTRSVSRQSRPLLERYPPVTRAAPATPVRPSRRSSRGSPTPCRRGNASTLSSVDWRRRCERKSISYPKASHLRIYVRSFTRTRPQSPLRTPHLSFGILVNTI